MRSIIRCEGKYALESSFVSAPDRAFFLQVPVTAVPCPYWMFCATRTNLMDPKDLMFPEQQWGLGLAQILPILGKEFDWDNDKTRVVVVPPVMMFAAGGGVDHYNSAERFVEGIVDGSIPLHPSQSDLVGFADLVLRWKVLLQNYFSFDRVEYDSCSILRE